MKIFDFIIIGSGPSAYGALCSLDKKNKKVLILESGPEYIKSVSKINSKSFHEFRNSDINQYKSLYSDQLYLDDKSIQSPKLESFEYLAAMKLNASYTKFHEINFKTTHASIYGGLSNFWGSGIACYSGDELLEARLPVNEMYLFYDSILNRIPVANNTYDDMYEYFGLKKISDTLKMSHLSQIFYDNYKNSLKKIINMSIGRPRLSVNLKDHDDIKKCSYRGNCLYGCQNNSIFNAKNYIHNLVLQNKMEIIFSQHVSHIVAKKKYNEVITEDAIFYGKKIIIAAGTIPTTKIVHKSLNLRKKVKLLSSPSAGFALYKPSFFNNNYIEESFFGLSQAAFKITNNNDNYFGAIFDPKALPISKFASYMPFSSKNNFIFSRHFLKSCLLGNIFLNGKYSNHSINFNADFSEVFIDGGYSSHIFKKLNFIKNNIFMNFLRLGFFYVPTSLKLSTPGSDSHYSGTINITDFFELGNCDNNCKIYGLENVYAVDGSVLNYLSEKSHTLTLMANAMRVVDKVVKQL